MENCGVLNRYHAEYPKLQQTSALRPQYRKLRNSDVQEIFRKNDFRSKWTLRAFVSIYLWDYEF